MPFLPLPDDDETLILREELPKYGFPQPSTFARWASRPSEAPCPLPYTKCGRRVAYTVEVLRRLRDAMTFRHSAERSVKAEEAAQSRSDSEGRSRPGAVTTMTRPNSRRRKSHAVATQNGDEAA